MKEVERIYRDISNVKIQGASNVIKAGIKAYLLDDRKNAVDKLLSLRATEPGLRNSIKILEKSKNKKETAEILLSYLDYSKNEIEKVGEKIIKDRMKIFVFCHSNSVISILKEGKKEGKNFLVINTETRPLMQGRITALELARAGIKVKHYVDSGTRKAVSESDIVMVGADALLDTGIVNKIGTGVVLDLAKELGKKVYVISSSIKYTKEVKIETRNKDEIWNIKNKNIDIENPAFEFVSKNYIYRIISELGILKYKKFAKRARKIWS